MGGGAANRRYSDHFRKPCTVAAPARPSSGWTGGWGGAVLGIAAYRQSGTDESVGSCGGRGWAITTANRLGKCRVIFAQHQHRGIDWTRRFNYPVVRNRIIQGRAMVKMAALSIAAAGGVRSGG